MPRVLTAEAEGLLRTLPGWAQNAPEHQALCQCFANEGARQRQMAQEVRDGMIPIKANELTLPLWETMLKLTVNPSGQTVEQRRAAVLAKLLQAPADPAGSTWEARVTAILGPSWTYEEEEGPGEEQQRIRVKVPWKPGSPQFIQAKRVLRREIPAAWELLVESAEGFILDLSELDSETFGGN